MNKKGIILLIIIIIAILILSVVSVCLGAGTVPPLTVVKILLNRIGINWNYTPDARMEAIVVLVRLPRIILAVLVGSALSLAGCVVQGLFRNPLATPEILGVSSGSSLGAVAAIYTGLAGLNLFLLPAFTITGALITAIAIYFLSTTRGSTSLLFIILAGLAVSAFLNGLTSMVLLVSREYEISQFVFWTLGGFESRSYDHILLLLPFWIPSVAVLSFFNRELNLFFLGEESAHSTGVNVELVKKLLLGFAAVLTGACVAVSGMIGFVGLLVPHVFRLLVGPDHRRLVPVSMAGGALFLLFCDT
ncbi:MAG: iron ABC transporter permease, partial [Spirochaetales bacterium]|nr:iron ABC transporter permease [Spirochaetales bacterium]